jgi:hypothetical protein
MDLAERGREGDDGVHLDQERDRRLALVATVIINLRCS